MSEHVHFLGRDRFAELVALLCRDYTVIAPVLEYGVLVLNEIHAVEDLPRGYSDVQQPGRYRATAQSHDRYFSYAAGPQSLKKFLYPTQEKIGTLRIRNGDILWEQPEQDSTRYAFLGVRSCDMHALFTLDKVLDQHQSPRYDALRTAGLFIAVNCTHPSNNCFCHIAGCGPVLQSGFDLNLTEIDTGFLLQCASEKGEAILALLPTRAAEPQELREAETALQQAEEHLQRQNKLPVFDGNTLKKVLYNAVESPHWQSLESRCLACGNCTSVCPTCFCSDVEDVLDLSGQNSERWRRIDSCFSHEFSYIHGGVIRASIAAKYRQWFSHKFATWYDQFGTSGCVGCGRCITWCPVGIDVRRELAVLLKE